IVPVSLPRAIGWVRDLPMLHYVYYLLWQVRALQRARQLNLALHFDVVHHVSYSSSWFPSLMGFAGPRFLCNAGARERTPWRFVLRAHMSWRGRLQEATRNVALQLLSPVADWIA